MALRSTKRGRFEVFENLGEVTSGELETLRAETRRLAKVANQRLVRLEKESRFGTSPAYKRAREDLATAFPTPRNRYRESVRTATREELIAEYKSLREFVTAKSSTVAGYEKIVMDRYKRFKEEEGVDISVEDYVEAWEKISADEKVKETYYKSQFKLIKEASQRYNDAKTAWDRMSETAREGKDPPSFTRIFADAMSRWSGQSFIERLRGERG